MIDEKKLMEDAYDAALSMGFNMERESYLYACGASWGIEKFSSQLIHSKEEIPETEKPLVLETTYNGHKLYQCYQIHTQEQWQELCHELPLTRWCYIEDIFTK